MDRPRFRVDFNELIEPDLVGLSGHDARKAMSGETITLREGLAVEVFEDDTSFERRPDALIASGVAVRNTTGFLMQIKWCCRIDDKGIRHQSDLADGNGSD
jgi:hypothetical protein